MKTRDKNKEKTFIDTDSLNAANKLKRKYNTKNNKLKVTTLDLLNLNWERVMSQQLKPLNMIEDAVPDCKQECQIREQRQSDENQILNDYY